MKKGKRNWLIAGGSILLLVLLVIFVDLKADIVKKQIKQAVPVEIYNSDGVKVGASCVTIKGTYCPHLFRRDFYSGKFSLPELPETENEDTVAEIKWMKRKGYPEESMIKQYGQTVYEDIGSSLIDINRAMTEFAWWTEVGTIATSYETYQNYKYFKK